MSIHLDGLTEEQVEMLDHMWSLDTMEDYMMWYDLLDEKDQRLADTLQRLILLEALDDAMAKTKIFPDAKTQLKQFML
jgi:hypothetical protein